jgi:acyl-CoA thioester hydrolase
MQKNPDQFHLVRANHIEYHRAVVGVSEMRVRVWVEHLGTTSLKFGFCVMPMDEDADCATGSRVVVRVDAIDHRKPTPWTPQFRATIAPFLASAAR